MAVATPTQEDLAVIENRATSVGRMFFDRVEQTPDREAYRYPSGDGWASVTWQQTGDRVRQLAAGLAALGVEPEQRVAIASATRYEWVLADLAIMCAGAATTTVYPSTMSADVIFILSDSQSRVVFAEDDTQIAKLTERRDELPEVEKVVTFDGTTDGDWIISLDELAAMGDALLQESPELVDERVAQTKSDNLATLIYTSGTTGQPKGVRLRHDSWTYEGAAIASVRILDIDDVQYLWLPMAHSFGKVLLTAQLQIGFPTAVDGRVDKIIDNLAVVKPTFMGAAPRIFEKAHARIVTMQQAEGGLKEKIFKWAMGVGQECSRREIAGEPFPRGLALQRKVADRLVFSKIRERFGGHVRFFISGSAGLNPEIAKWFHAVGILILEGYGLTETSAGSAVNRPTNNKFGTVGLPFPGMEFKVGDDGELLMRGPGIMDGYHNLPELTGESLEDEGWFHTGDIGEIDEDGFVRVTDRKKDLFKTSGGKYVAPSVIESQFKAICPYASQLLVHGADRSYCTAIVTLDPDAMQQWAEQHGMSGKSYAEIVSSPEAESMVSGYIEELNKRLNRWETVKRFVLLDHEFSVEGGEVTPSLKMRRRAVEEKYQAELDALYN